MKKNILFRFLLGVLFSSPLLFLTAYSLARAPEPPADTGVITKYDKKEAAGIAIEKAVESFNENMEKFGVDEKLAGGLKTLANVAKNADTYGTAAEKAYIYEEKYRAWQDNGGKETDEFGRLTSEYKEVADAATDFLASLAPDEYSPAFDLMKDLGEVVKSRQRGETPDTKTTIGKAINNVVSATVDHHGTIEMINQVYEWDKERLGAGNTGQKELGIGAKCPLDFLIIAPDGKRAGIDPKTKNIIEEIPGSMVIKPNDYNIESELVILPYLKIGEYKIEIYGFGNGPFTLLAKTYDLKGKVLDREIIDSEIKKGQVFSATFNPYAADLNKNLTQIVLKDKKVITWKVTGGVLVLALLILGAFYFYKKRKNK